MGKVIDFDRARTQMIQKKQKKSQITNKSNVAVYEEKVNHKILIGFILITLLTFMLLSPLFTSKDNYTNLNNINDKNETTINTISPQSIKFLY
ncbi:MAG: hypothetical protein N4A54_10145 [Peptostreptococcaceae bacterium]|jgi:hypothetical protein|nr:hypothetical protein [Peptostreptococcaceae bacterium]